MFFIYVIVIMLINIKTFIKMTTPDYPLGRIFVVDDTDVSKTVFKTIDELVVLETELLDLKDAPHPPPYQSQDFNRTLCIDPQLQKFRIKDSMYLDHHTPYFNFGWVRARLIPNPIQYDAADGVFGGNAFIVNDNGDGNDDMNEFLNVYTPSSNFYNSPSGADFSILNNTGPVVYQAGFSSNFNGVIPYPAIPYSNIDVDVSVYADISLANIDDNLVCFWLLSERDAFELLNNSSYQSQVKQADVFYNNDTGAGNRFQFTINKKMYLTGGNPSETTQRVFLYVSCRLKNDYQPKASFDIGNVYTLNFSIKSLGVYLQDI